MLKKINEYFYSYLDLKTGMLFSLKYGDRGVYGLGKAWYLKVIYSNETLHIATFSVKDDGHKTYKQDLEGRLWVTSEVFRAANQMVKDMLNN